MTVRIGCTRLWREGTMGLQRSPPGQSPGRRDLLDEFHGSKTLLCSTRHHAGGRVFNQFRREMLVTLW